MSGSGAMPWWWGNYIRNDASMHRDAPAFPLNERINPPLRDFFAGEDLAGMALEASTISAPASVVASASTTAPMASCGSVTLRTSMAVASGRAIKPVGTSAV